MYMRIWQAKVKPERLSDIRQVYEEKVIPSLQNVHGCMFASLMQSEAQPDECISMTLWDDQSRAEAYAKSDLFRALVDDLKPFLADSTEWRIQLSKELTIEYEPVPEEPTVKSYSVAAQTEAVMSGGRPQSMYVRIVSPRIRPGKMEEFKQIYANEVLPVLHSVKGCRYAYLTEGAKDKNEVISVTIWDSQREAEDYETGGLFDQMKNKVKHTFSELYQWKMKLEKDAGKPVATSEDMTVKHYNVVTGKSFR
jgi:quinol monooxygenase YgiN